MWELLLVLLLIAGSLYKGWVSWRTIWILLVVYIILTLIFWVYMYRISMFSSKYLTFGNIVYKIKNVSKDPYFMADDGGSDYVILTGKVKDIIQTKALLIPRDTVVVEWKYITQPKVGNKYLPLGTYAGKDFTWNLSTYVDPTRTYSVNDPIVKIIEKKEERMSDTDLYTDYPTFN